MFQNDMNSTFYDITRYKHFFNLKNRFSPKMTDNWINKEVVIVEGLSLENNKSLHKPIKKPNRSEIRFKGEHVKIRIFYLNIKFSLIKGIICCYYQIRR